MLLPHLYYNVRLTNGDYSVRSESEFKVLTRRVLQRVLENDVASDRRSVPLPPEMVDGIGIMLRELFDNTHKWATRDAYGVKLRNSARAILVRIFSPQSNSENDACLTRYFSSNPTTNSYIEISVIDSGPGLVARLNGKDTPPETPIDQELDDLYRCLAKGQSTSRQPGRGYGLYNVIRNLTGLRGFMRIRTGRLCVYRDTVNYPVQHLFKEKYVEGMLHDWATESNVVDARANARGAAFSFLIPLN